MSLPTTMTRKEVTSARKAITKTQGDALARIGGEIACLRPSEVEAKLPAMLEAVAASLGDLSALLPEEPLATEPPAPEAPAEPG